MPSSLRTIHCWECLSTRLDVCNRTLAGFPDCARFPFAVIVGQDPVDPLQLDLRDFWGGEIE